MSKKTGGIVVVLFGICCLIGIVGYFLGGFSYSINQENAENFQAEEQQEYVEAFLTEAEIENYTITIADEEYIVNNGAKTYLFMGTDLSGNENGTEGDYQGAMADVLMLIVIDENAKTYGVLQLDRDTITKVKLMQADGSAYASAQLQLCTAHWYGGDKAMSCENTQDAVSGLLGGLKINGYYAVSYEAMPVLNRAVHGVNVVLEDDMTMFDPQMTKGAALRLTDEQAVILLQSRYGMQDDKNAGRMRRQRSFLTSFMQQFKEKNREDKDFIIDLYSQLRIYATDNLNMNEIVGICDQMQEYKFLGIHVIDGKTVLGQRLEDGENHWEFYPDEQSLVNVLEKLNLIGRG